MTLRLVPVTREQAAAVVDGGGAVAGIAATRGWPHADTVDALRPLAAGDAAAVGTFFVELDGVVIGECGWYGPPGDDGEVEIGYGLAAPLRSRGHGTAAVRELVAWVSAQPGVRVIAAGVEAGNVASRRVLERLGFTVTEAGGARVRYALRVG